MEERDILSIRLALIETYRTLTLEYAGFTIALVVGLVTELTQVLSFWHAGAFQRGFIVAVISGTVGLGLVGFFQSAFWGRMAEAAIAHPPVTSDERYGKDPMNVMNHVYGDKVKEEHPNLDRFSDISTLFRFTIVAGLALIIGAIAGLA